MQMRFVILFSTTECENVYSDITITSSHGSARVF